MNQIDKPNPFYPKAKVIAHSVSAVSGIEMITYEVEFWRGVLAELNTHNALSKNTSSSRAIPVKDMLAQVRDNPAGPVRFGKANKGMQDAGEHDGLVDISGFNDGSANVPADVAWMYAVNSMAEDAERFHEAGYAKQVCNRLVEAGQWTKMVLSGTDWNNFMWLRKHGAADPSVDALARVIEEARANSTPTVLQPGEWHVPYYNDGVWKAAWSEVVDGVDIAVDKFGHSLEHVLMISSSCCAQASYRQLDDTVEKARRVSANLNLRGEQPDEPVHASPTEHQATPIKESRFLGGDLDNGVNLQGVPDTWQEGITHVRRDGVFCSGNLRGWIQHRQLIPGNVKEG